MIPKKLKDIVYLASEKENHYFERKSARIRPIDTLKHIVGFSNADGGHLVIGIENDGTITGFNNKDANPIEEFKKISLTGLRETPVMCESFELEVVNNADNVDTVLILSIQPSYNKMIQSYDGKVYLRDGDKTKELNYSQITQLQYDRGERFFEDEINTDSSINDVNRSLVEDFKKKMGTPDISVEQLLVARGFLKESHLTNAGILLFSDNPTKYLPQARLRFIRYDGKQAQVGTHLNIVKEQTFEGPIPTVIQQAKDFIATQFREFQYLDKDGKFKIMPEYPEFAWFEGIVNALTHRNYSIRGEHIKVIMFDDRLEILSPGALPNLVTLENILNQRYSRNPRIARILSEFGWVKEMNEGVKRIYSDMENFFLKSPTYSEPNRNSVLLVLENNILNRSVRLSDQMRKLIDSNIYSALTEEECTILYFAFNSGSINSKTAAKLIGRSRSYTNPLLKAMTEKRILEWHGSSKTDPEQFYTVIKNDK